MTSTRSQTYDPRVGLRDVVQEAKRGPSQGKAADLDSKTLKANWMALKYSKEHLEMVGEELLGEAALKYISTSKKPEKVQDAVVAALVKAKW
jgi:hypothetical protein